MPHTPGSGEAVIIGGAEIRRWSPEDTAYANDLYIIEAYGISLSIVLQDDGITVMASPAEHAPNPLRLTIELGETTVYEGTPGGVPDGEAEHFAAMLETVHPTESQVMSWGEHDAHTYLDEPPY